MKFLISLEETRMRIRNAYRIVRFFSRFHIHPLKMMVWHILRFYLNKRLPEYYKKHNAKEGRSSKEYTDRDVILSMTTSPKRMKSLPIVIESLLRQTVKPTYFQLWLADEQYPDKEALLRDMKPYIDRGLDILFCEDLKSHKKYYYAMKENPNAIVITVDDDIIYSETMIEDLLRTYRKHPECVVARRAHQILFEGDKVLPYNNWNSLATGCTGPDLHLCATGCGGCLYPPYLLPEETFNKEVIKELCFYADDLWLKCMEQMNHVPTVLTGINNPEIITTIGSDEGGLAELNVLKGKNDEQFRSVTEHYGIKWIGDAASRPSRGHKMNGLLYIHP